MRVVFLSAEKGWKRFNVVFAPLKPSMVTSGDLHLAALVPCRSLAIRTGGLVPFYSFQTQMPLNSDTPTNSLKVGKICSIGQRKDCFNQRLSTDLISFSFTCVRVSWWQLATCSFLGKLPLEKASVGLCPVPLHPSSPAAWGNLLPRSTPMSILVNFGAECLVFIVQLTSNYGIKYPLIL